MYRNTKHYNKFVKLKLTVKNVILKIFLESKKNLLF